ncbi:hypothetical protein TGAMA5MH_04467 [Trichoderma gamsii]|uniref:Uncharacterized protein n=1 Tax=Trichoderma gamsii TaxID=398673 RepID=A0A2K0TDA2_9HYPO|nr:hypothetical protein TGAMA5MH_04467 [Trichoderma gamsii]
MHLIKLFYTTALLIGVTWAVATPELVDIEARDDPKIVPRLLTPPPTPKSGVVEDEEEWI